MLLGASEPDLDTLVRSYFLAADHQRRDLLAAQIGTQLTGDLGALESSIQSMNIWPEVDEPIQHITQSAEGSGEVFVSLPNGYSPAKQIYPVVIALHGTGGSAAAVMRSSAVRFRRFLPELIVAAPQSVEEDVFKFTEGEMNQPAHVLDMLRRQYRIDNDRVFLTGYSKGGHATCMLALMFADRWAGAIPLAGTVMFPRREGIYRQVLGNVKHLPVLICWGELDKLDGRGKPSPTGGIAGANRKLSAVAAEMELPWTAVGLADVGHGGVAPPADELGRILQSRRARYPKNVSHRFKFPSQGSAYWLRLRRFIGEPWRDNRLVVKLKPGESRQAALDEGFSRRMGYLGGTIGRQTISITSRRAAEIELLLHDELLSLNESITIVYNGRKVFSGKIDPSAALMLEQAYRTRDFQRLFSARVILPYRGKPRIE